MGEDDRFVLSVTELNAYVSDKFYQDAFLDEIWVGGEICDLNTSHGSAFFVLSDGQASVDCILFDYGMNENAKYVIEGTTVVLRGDISIYRRNGRFRIAVIKVEPTGAGELYANFNLLREKLDKLGVFKLERKRELPAYPKKIGIVTSGEGAVIHDIVNIAGRRNPLVKLTLYPIKVQGEGAPGQIVSGIKYFNEHTDADVLIVGRGGGSAEDLFAFNDEDVVLEIYGSRIPVISAVGHESDYTLADMAADLRAPTPSAAAELAVPLIGEIEDTVRGLKREIKGAVRGLIGDATAELRYARGGISAEAIRRKLATVQSDVQGARQAQRKCVDGLLNTAALSIASSKAAIDSMDPQKVFERGYSISEKNGSIVHSVGQLEKEDVLRVWFADGSVQARVMSVEKDNG